ncbi:hypothetical protein C1Y63_09300 [Corynebacterium sp. 13CS0277]|uniref:hypothetical protein n=1 Tax=Corynebacterium sp. 13CS0277 TaxID=2071994 RepID=UPI000D040E68|nr:hypothetical protein [Corynebacterium sp. 13CS0277]PRQ10826.1 hypothetical protein C1Y63_09300 [Corynebacterium sp. 13CS0277]
MSIVSTGVRRIAALAASAGLCAAWVVAGAVAPTGTVLPAAQAIPPGGPGANTPGTDSDISPMTLEPCDTINFSVTGYPAGEVVYMKIDDGIGYGDTTVQGSGVIHRHTADSNGTANGSFDLPCDIAPGSHWLRFLSSEAQIDENGQQIGSKGFTNRSVDFTVVPASGANAARAEEAKAEAEAQTSGTGVDSAAVAQAVQQATRNTKNGRTTTTRTVGAPAPAAEGQPAAAEPAAAAAAAPAAAAAAPAAKANAGAKDAKDAKKDSKTPKVLSAGGSKGAKQTGTNAAGEEVVYDTTSGEVVYAQGSNSAPMIGLLVGGAILIVGFGGIAAYLYVNRARGGQQV